jgi:hypothetical protein
MAVVLISLLRRSHPALTGQDRRDGRPCGLCHDVSGRVHGVVAVGNVGVVGKVNKGRGCICIAASLFPGFESSTMIDCV